MKRWIPKVGETVTVAGNGQDLPAWTGEVVKVRKSRCDPGTVYLTFKNLGSTTAHASEITIHPR